MAKVEIKQPIVDEIAGYLADAQAMVLVDYRGLTVEEDTQLRKALREAGVDYKVYKNTLIKRAVKGTVFEDATAPARVLYEAAKKMPNLELKGGVVDGTFYDEKMIQVIATIPSREVLLGKLLGSIQSPITNFARVIKQIAESKEEVA